MADPNTLYATIVQSSAAIVAIVAGFLTATVVNMAASRTSIVEQIAERERELRTLEDIQNDARLEHERLRAARILEDNEDTLVSSYPFADAAEVQASLGATHIDKRGFAKALGEYRDWMAPAHDLISQSVEKFGADELPFDHWASTHQIKIEPNLYWYADKFFYLFYKERNPPPPPRKPSPSEMQYGIDVSMLLKPTAAEAAEERADRRQEQAAHEAALEKQRDVISEAKRRAKYVTDELQALNSRLLTANRPPPNLWVAVAALVYLVLVGLVYPLALLPQGPADFDLRQKGIAIILFAIGLIWVLLYVLALMLPMQVDGARKGIATSVLAGKSNLASKILRRRRSSAETGEILR